MYARTTRPSPRARQRRGRRNGTPLCPPLPPKPSPTKPSLLSPLPRGRKRGTPPPHPCRGRRHGSLAAAGGAAARGAAHGRPRVRGAPEATAGGDRPASLGRGARLGRPMGRGTGAHVAGTSAWTGRSVSVLGGGEKRSSGTCSGAEGAHGYGQAGAAANAHTGALSRAQGGGTCLPRPSRRPTWSRTLQLSP